VICERSNEEYRDKEMRLAARVITLGLLISLSLAAFGDTLTGKVGRVVDGDTLYVLDANYKDHKIRLAGIDAPERRQAYGLASRKHLASIVAGRQVTVEYQKRNRYGRIVGKVWIDGVDACLEQIKAGLAWHYKKSNTNKARKTESYTQTPIIRPEMKD